LNLTRLVQATREVDTERIDLQIGGNGERYLLRGWMEPQQHYTQMEGPESHVRFDAYAVGEPIGVRFTFVDSAAPQPGTLEVRANDVEVGRFELAPGLPRKRSFTIPAAVARSGTNTLAFRFAEAGSPPVEANAPRPIALRSIVFDAQPQLAFGEHGTLIQHADAEFRVVADLPRTFEIESEYQIAGGSTATILVCSEGAPDEAAQVHRIAIDPLETRLSERVTFERPGPYVFQFTTRGPANGSVVWKQFDIRFERFEPTAERVGGREARPATPSRPDIFLYVIDTLRADHLGSYGYSRPTSPNIDQLASEGTLFENAFSNSSWTRTSAASIWTGLYPKNHRTFGRDDMLPADLVTLAEKLKEQGYETAAFVGNGNLIATFGFDQGFDSFRDLSENLEEPALLSYLSDHINDSVFAYLDRRPKSNPRIPLFLVVWTIDPHFPYAPREDVEQLFGIERYEPIDTTNNKLFRRIRTRKVEPSRSQIEYMLTRYDQEIFFNDRSFGAFVRKLEEADLYRDAVTILTSDHGEEFFDHGFVGHGLTLYGEQVEIPLIIKGPGFEAGTRSPLPVQLVDLYPTVMEIVGAKQSDSVDGVSILSNSGDGRELYFEQKLDRVDLAAVLGPDRKLMFNKRIDRPLASGDLPIFEAFSREDRLDQEPTAGWDLRDQLNLQRLHAYLKQRNVDVEAQKATISKPLDERLKALGYAR